MKKITFNKKVYYVSHACRCYSGRIVGIYSCSNEALVIFDGDTEETCIGLYELFETRGEAINNKLADIEKRAKRIGADMMLDVKQKENEILNLEMESDFLKSQLKEAQEGF